MTTVRDVQKNLRRRRLEQGVSDLKSQVDFSRDVVQQRCFHLTEYDLEYLAEALNPFTVVGLPKIKKLERPIVNNRLRKPVPRFHGTGYNTAHICPLGAKLQKLVPLKPVKRVTRRPQDEESIYEVKAAAIRSAEDAASHWDEFILSQVSEGTARWIVHKVIPTQAPHQKRLVKRLDGWYGELKEASRVELIPERAESRATTAKATAGWRAQESFRLDGAVAEQAAAHAEAQRLREEEEAEQRELEEMMSLDFQDKRREQYDYDRPPSSISDATSDVIEIPGRPINPRVLPFVMDEMALLPHLPGTEEGEIIMENMNMYTKSLDEKWPPALDDQQKRSMEKGKQRRWKEYPRAVDTSSRNEMRIISALPRPPRKVISKEALPDTLLSRVVTDWRTRWKVNVTVFDPDELLTLMGDCQANERLRAVTTTAFLAHAGHTPPDYLLRGVECLLRDSNADVQKAAAIVLASLKRFNSEVDEILQKCLAGDEVDQWAAAQALAHNHVVHSGIVDILVREYLSADTSRRSTSLQVMREASCESGVVHTVLCEQLNSPLHAERAAACHCLAELAGDINRDTLTKLSQLMWEDPHGAVRLTAAHAIGATDNGLEVHDQLTRRLSEQSGREKAETLRLLSKLGIMTAKLQPIFVACFEDDYVSVRCEAILVCRGLRPLAPQLVAQVRHRAERDPLPLVRLVAVQTLAGLVRLDKETELLLQRILQLEREEELRLLSLRALRTHKFNTPEFIEILKNRLLSEPSSAVKEEISLTMAQLGIDPNSDIDMVRELKNSVKALCTIGLIYERMAVQEHADTISNFKKNTLAAGPRDYNAKKTSTYASRTSMTTSGPDESDEKKRVYFSGVTDDERESTTSSVAEELVRASPAAPDDEEKPPRVIKRLSRADKEDNRVANLLQDYQITHRLRIK